MELSWVEREIAKPFAFIVVEGEPGSGKTDLLRRVARSAAQERTVLEFRCVRERDPVPLAPLLDALGAAADRWTGPAGRLSPLAGVLRPLLPEFSAVLPEPLGSDRHLVHRALRELLTLPERALLIVDDADQADEETQDFLRLLAARPSERLAVVTGSALRLQQRTLRDAWWPPRSGVTARHVLKPLRIADVVEKTGSCELAQRVHRRTGGVAAAVTAVLEAISGLDVPAAMKLVEKVVPAAWAAELAARFAVLEHGAAAIVSAAVTLGRPAGGEALAAVAGSDATGMVDDLLQAMAAGFLRDLGNDRYAVRSPLVADAVDAAIPGPRRSQLHSGAARLLACADEPQPRRVAYHHREAGELDEWARYVSESVDQAAAEGRPGEAVRLLEAALRDPALSRARKENFAVRLSRQTAYGLIGESTLRLLRTAAHDWPLSDAARGEIRINLGRVLINQVGQVDAGRSEIELAIADLDGRQALLARGLITLALPHIGPVPVEENLRRLDQAERASKGTGDVELLAAVTANRVSGRMQVADPGVWQDVGTLPASPRSAEVRRQVSRTYVNLADAAAWNGYYPVARTYLATARRLVHDEEQPYLEALAAGTALRLDVATGIWPEVETEVLGLVGRVGRDSSLAAEPLLALAWYQLGNGRRKEASRNFDAAFTLAAGNVPQRASAFAGRVAVLLAAKELAVAARLVESGLESVRRKNNWVWGAELLPPAVQVLLARGESDAAERLVAEYGEGIAGRDAPLAHAAALFCRGLLARARPADAVEFFRQAALSYQALPRPHAAAGASELAGECYAALGDHRKLLGALTSAETIYRSLKSVTDAQRCRRTLARHDPTTPSRGRRGYGQALSPRELEVARLAAQNLSNREIAERLFLSARTVEVHISRALNKLELPSRAVLGEHLSRELDGMPRS
ncbi:LuxR C-terminal-related transcriptional regulator [Amycolatopsis sp. QT-25]|uniref:LuxR C-terminal-related transcriptional regulator n=1 Tax=Amycolatopsis sp. QT-25 TaxID=3034022 RepID=UPI0023EC0EA6|nr:LuxR family transcriptional regulator [Amycolatopsis sp. QT-25]WET76952.1 LuxR C-terminal-related transcriptional regulator [Amycolatopsis sp. QT-25]